MPVKKQQARWSTSETKTLLNCLRTDVPCSSIEPLVPNRTVKSIRRKALRLGHSSYTENGEIYFRLGIKHRKNKSKTVHRVNNSITINKIITSFKTSISTILKSWSK